MKEILSSFIDLFSTENKSKETPHKESYKILTAERLLNSSELNTNLYQQIISLTSLPDEIFKLYYKPIIYKYAEFSQSLPASRSHHHANAGGLLTHTLEVVKFGLQFKEKYVLPPNTPSENLSKAQQRWFYGVFLTCLLHDIGKVMSDMLCHVYDKNGNHLGRWCPLVGPMTILPKAYSYTLKFSPKANYSLHKELAILLTTTLVPTKILDWLQRDTELFYAILLTLRGEPQHSSILSEVVKRADSESTKRNIGANTLQRIDRGHLSLPDKILKTINFLVKDGKSLKYNTPGSNIFVYQGALYAVSKVFVDLLRTTMLRNGYTDIPSNNTRVFDIMQQHNIIESTKDDKAVWTGLITLNDTNKWEQKMSFIKIPISTLVLSQEEIPKDMNGVISFAEPTKKQQTTPTSTNQSADEKASNCNQHKEKEDQKTNPIETRGDTPNSTKSIAIRRGEEFIKWLRYGISNETLHYNDTKAPIHVVTSEKLIFLLSPKIFKLFMEQASDDILKNLQLNREQFTRLQVGFAKLALHKNNPKDNNLLHTVLVKNRSGLKSMNGILLEDWQVLFNQEPPLNNKILLDDIVDGVDK